MFCPKCRVEYRAGFAHCNDCGVDLVEQLAPDIELESTEHEADKGCVTLLWRSLEGSVFNELSLALEEAGIPYERKILELQIKLTSTYTPLEIWIPPTEAEHAQRILRETFRRLSESSDSNDSPTSTTNDEELQRKPCIVREPISKEATCEAWTGSDGNTAQFLKLCLAENGIGCYIENNSQETVVVRILPKHEASATEIVRQVLHGSPLK